MRFDVDKLDYAYPTLVRYAGLISTLVLIGFCLAGFTVEAAPGFAASGAMILYKTFRDAASVIKKEGDKPNEQ